MHTIPHIY